MMGQEEELELYRSQLLESLNGQSSRSARSASEPIQVYINEHACRRTGWNRDRHDADESSTSITSRRAASLRRGRF